MHTFFVNTSKRSLNYYDILFDICRENMDLISFDYPMTEWYSLDKGYAACAKKMATQIDDHMEITNEFDLIVYVDLCEVKQYVGIARDEARTKAVVLRALRMLYLHLISETLVKELGADIRRPINTLIMFGEDNDLDKDFERDNNDRFREDVTKTMMGFCGLPAEEQVLTDIARESCASGIEDPKAAFRERLRALRIPTELPGAAEAYEQYLSQWYGDVVEYKDVHRAILAFGEKIERQYAQEDRYSSVHWVSCLCGDQGVSRNKSAHALVQLSIACYLAECVYTKTVLGDDGRPRKFALCDGAKLASILTMKKDTFSTKLNEIERVEKTYPSMGLAPELYKLDHQRFGLDEQGDRIFTYEEVAQKSDKGSDETADEEGAEAAPKVIRKEEEGEWDPRVARFPYRGDELFGGMDPTGKDPNKYRVAAQTVRDHHAKYLTRLSKHARDVLANYACDSTGNFQAILRKRAVSIADKDYVDPANDHKYAPAKDPVDKRKVEVAEEEAKRAYRSAVMRYLEFCAARSVAVTDIEEHYEWISRRIDAIEASLKRLKTAALGCLLALIILYVPFVVIQWESLIADPLTVLVALASLATPMFVLGAVYTILAAYHRSKFIRVWRKFKENSDKVLDSNANAAYLYDRLLAQIIPALRWIYEYKLDVDFHHDCCDFAEAKLHHHMAKLRERVTAIGNIIEDLEVAQIPPYKAGDQLLADVDLNVSYCTGAKNVNYYSILNKALLQALREGEGV